MSAPEQKIAVPALSNVQHVATGAEFTLDMAYAPPGGTQALLLGRYALSPQCMKGLARVIAASIKQYEERFGEIRMPDEAPEPEIIYESNN